MQQEPKKNKILAMRITSNDHRILKVESAKRDMTIKELILISVKSYLENNCQY